MPAGLGGRAGPGQLADHDRTVANMADFVGDPKGTRFERIDLSGAEFRAVKMVDTRFRGVEMNRVVMRGVELVDVDIHGEIAKLTINGIDVGALVNAELNRRYPERVKMRPTDVAGFREAWDVIERLWAGTVERARQLGPALLHEADPLPDLGTHGVKIQDDSFVVLLNAQWDPLPFVLPGGRFGSFWAPLLQTGAKRDTTPSAAGSLLIVQDRSLKLWRRHKGG